MNTYSFEAFTNRVLVKPQNINNTPINGDGLVRPWKIARRMMICLIAAAMTTNDAITVKVQGRLASDGTTWENMKAWDGTTDLGFTVSKTSNGGVGDYDTTGTGTGVAGIVTGTLMLQKVNSKYDAVRLQLVNAVAQNVVMGAVGVLMDLFYFPSDTVDDLFSKQLAP